MKKIISAFLFLVMILSLSSCNGTGEVPDPEQDGSEIVEPGNDNSEITENQMEMFKTEVLSPKSNVIIQDSREVSFFENPVIGVEDEHIIPGWCIGDPFVLRHNGMYYLYPSSIGTGVQCWTSTDLANWTYAGICMPEDTGGGCWAPEVTYYNGKFYMYTSPGGNGHYVYESETPTGPFVVVSENFGLDWDGNVFIDDDGKWTIYTAENGGDAGGIQVTDITTSPTFIDRTTTRGSGIEVYTVDSDWTEGSMLIKYNGIYYMTYCGNRVASKSYQIRYSASTGTLNDFEYGINNPLLLNTDPSTDTGLGHSSSVIGPNLDSWYIVYHSMIVDPIRQMHIAPMYMNGVYLQVLGHVETAPVPEMPDLYSRFNSEESLSGWVTENAKISDGILVVSEGGKVVSEKGFADDYTVEWNFRYIDGKAGGVFGSYDDKNYGTAFMDTQKNELEVIFVVDGEEKVYNVPIKGSFDGYLDFKYIQTLTLRKYGTEYTFLMNNIEVLKCNSELGGGAIGVASEKGESKFGFVGATGNVWLSSMKEYNKPVEGEIQAITCIENDLVLVDHDIVKHLSVSGGETYNYYVNVTEAEEFTLGVHYSSTSEVGFEMYQNGKLILTGELPETDGSSFTEVFSKLNLEAGIGVLSFKFTSGTAEVFSYEFVKTVPFPSDYQIDIAKPDHAEDVWSVTDGVFNADYTGKYIYGDRLWSDYSVSATFTPKSRVFSGNLMFRVTNESIKNDAINGGELDLSEGQNWYQGYYLNVVKNNKHGQLSIYRQNYTPELLIAQPVDIEFGEAVHVTVEVVGANIKVYYKDELVIDYTDPEPFLRGRVGFQKIATSLVSDFEIKPINN